MNSIAILFATGEGHTECLAEHIAEGAEATGLAVPILFDVTRLTTPDWQALAEAEAMVFGAPTYMGGAAAGFKTFMDATSDLWAEQAWADKVAAGFTVGTYPSGDKLATLQQLAIFAAQHGMIWVGQNRTGPRPIPGQPRSVNAEGSWLGLMASSSPDKTLLIDQADADTAYSFGARLAAATRRWQS